MLGGAGDADYSSCSIILDVIAPGAGADDTGVFTL